MVVLGLRPERCHLLHGRTSKGDHVKSNGYEILAIIPAEASEKSGRPEVWYLVGVSSETSAVCATTYDLTCETSWAQGSYVDLPNSANPGDAYRKALEIAKQKAGLVRASTRRSERVDALLAELEMLVDESRDETLSDFYHDAGNGAYFAGAFDELNGLLRDGAEPPKEWRRD